MPRTRWSVLVAATLMGVLSAPPAQAATALSIFPSDTLTVPDTSQATGRRVNLPFPDCSVFQSDCNEIALLNQLDGFDLDPTIAIGFGEPIDLALVDAASVFVRPLGGNGPDIPLNRLVWSPARNTLYGHPAQMLREVTRYKIVVDDSISGQSGVATFTTMSATADLVKMRQQLDDGSAYEAAGIALADQGLDFNQSTLSGRSVFRASNVVFISRFDDDTPAGDHFSGGPIPISSTANAGLYAFGSFLSPSWLTPDRVIPATPSLTGSPAVTGFERVQFDLIVPDGPKPAGGWPVLVFGPGITRSKHDVFLAADFNAQNGFATIAIDPVGHGFGPNSSIAVKLADRISPVGVRMPGRGRDHNGDGAIDSGLESIEAPVQPHPLASVALRDGLRQTALDNMALVRAIARGVDVEGDGSVDLSTTAFGYYAQSLGGIYGTMLMAADPVMPIGMLNVPGGPIAEIARLSPGFRPLVAAELGNRVPGLLNGGRDGFTESLPLYLDPPVNPPVIGAVPIQQALTRVNWLDRAGSPESYAPLLRERPLAGVGPKDFFYQFAFGDQTVPNPTSATLMRAGVFPDLVTFYRNDKTPSASSDPHGFLLDPRLSGRQFAQRQMIEFFASGGTIIDPDDGAPVFEVPIEDPNTLETLNFDQPPAEGQPGPETS